MSCLFVTVPQTSSLAGCLWGQQCHLDIPSLPHINLIPMMAKKNKLIPDTTKGHERVMIGMPIPKVYTPQIHTVESTLKPTKYWIPINPNNTTFDAFFRSGPKGIGLQMTHRIDHSLAPKGLDELKKRLSTTKAEDRYFVFIIPQGQVFSCPKPLKKWLSEFSFFILEMECGKYC